MKTILVILDGWGYTPEIQGNPLASASLSTVDYLLRFYPTGLLKASGIVVGLPWGEPGNSEVGHITIGSGQIILHYLSRIAQAIKDGSFLTNEAFLAAVDNVKKNQSQLHIMGLLGSGSVHSYLGHLYSLLELGRKHGISSRVKLHLFTDGKDSPPQEAVTLIAELKKYLTQTGDATIASFVGRDYAMDRDANWDKTQKAFNLFVKGEGEKVTDAVDALQKYYQQGYYDNNIPPTAVVDEEGALSGRVSPADSIIFFDYREDSARQFTKSFMLPQLVPFAPQVPPGLVCATFSQYDQGFPALVAFPPPKVSSTFADVLEEQGKLQLHIAETGKYAHVTYFFNGLRETPHRGETWRLIPSLKEEVESHPEMKAHDIVEIIVQEITRSQFDTIIVNIANADLVAHGGNFSAAVRACEIVDQEIAKLVGVIESQEEYMLFISADHGHVEHMISSFSGEGRTQHTANDVPYYVVHPSYKKEHSALEVMDSRREAPYMLADIAPTLLDIMKLPIPSAMVGKSFLDSLR